MDNVLAGDGIWNSMANLNLKENELEDEANDEDISLERWNLELWSNSLFPGSSPSLDLRLWEMQLFLLLKPV